MLTKQNASQHTPSLKTLAVKQQKQKQIDLVFLSQEIDRSNLSKIFGQNISRVLFPINMIWFNLFILN